jgi:hypothetical protein
MTSPSIRTGHTGTAFSGTPSTWTVDFPSTVESGDTLVVVVVCTSGAIRTFTPPSGWSSEQKDTQGSNLTTEWFTKDTVTGSEDSGSDDWILDTGSNGAAYSFAISGGDGSLVFATAAGSAGSSTPDPPSLTHGLGSVDALFIAFCGLRDDDATVSAYPTNYSHLQADQQSGGGANNSASLGIAARQYTAASDDPGTFTLSESENWVAQTVAMGPAAAAGPTLEDSTVSNVTATTSSPSIDLPATVDAGDHLLAVAAWNRWDGVLALTSSGWAVLYKTNLHAYHSFWVLHKVADGTEDGGTITWSTSGPHVIGGGVVLRVSGAYDGGNGVGVAIAHDTSRGYGNDPDPPEVTAPWGGGDQLYAAIQTNGNSGATATAPSGYGSLAQTTVSGGTEVATAVRSETSASDDPAAFTLSTNENFWAAAVVFRDADTAADITATPTGGIVAGGEAPATFSTTVGAEVPTDVTIEWDFDNDGDFDRDAEDITGDVVELDLLIGRDYPSQLTGRAIPATLTMTVLNDDDRYQPYNTSSPLTTAPLSLDPGRKLRVRATEATAVPEPARLIRDRFGESGALTATEEAEPWSPVVGGAWTVADGGASADDSGESITVVDARSATGYYQARVRHIDADNEVSIIYRFTNDDNYGAVTVTPHTVTHHVVTGGTPTSHTSQAIEVRPHMTIGVEVDSADDVTVYLDGVALFVDTGDAHNSAVGTEGTGWGIRSDWNNHRSPIVDEIGMWTGLWATVDGILGTLDVQGVQPYEDAAGQQLATITASGRLARLQTEVTPPTSIGATAESAAGVTTGLMVGQVLATVGELHPPPPGGLSEGETTLGGVGTGNAEALYVARLFEDTELGFLFETNEGPVAFDDRSARAARQVVAAFGDTASVQFSPERPIEILSLRQEVFNQATGEVAPATAVLEHVETTTGNDGAGSTSAITVTIPSGPTAEAGWLNLVMVAPTCQIDDEPIEAPTGWAALGGTGSGVALGREHWFAKKLTSGDLGASVTFYDASTTGGGAWIVRQFLVSGWYGEVDSGVAVSAPAGVTGSEAQAGTVTPPTVLIPWGRQPCLAIATRTGLYTTSTTSVSATDPDDAPNGYRDLDSDAVAATVSTADVASQCAWRHASVGIESPSAFGGTFTGFDHCESTTVAVRGYAGDPPEESTGELVTVDDLDSQERHNLVSDFPRIGQFFADTTAADTWADLVLDTFGSPRPLVRIRFHANASALHRWIAYHLRVSDLVRLVCTGRTGIGVNALYHVESIRHHIDFGNTRWSVEYQLAPAAD